MGFIDSFIARNTEKKAINYGKGCAKTMMMSAIAAAEKFKPQILPCHEISQLALMSRPHWSPKENGSVYYRGKKVDFVIDESIELEDLIKFILFTEIYYILPESPYKKYAIEIAINESLKFVYEHEHKITCSKFTKNNDVDRNDTNGIKEKALNIARDISQICDWWYELCVQSFLENQEEDSVNMSPNDEVILDMKAYCLRFVTHYIGKKNYLEQDDAKIFFSLLSSESFADKIIEGTAVFKEYWLLKNDQMSMQNLFCQKVANNLLYSNYDEFDLFTLQLKNTYLLMKVQIAVYSTFGDNSTLKKLDSVIPQEHPEYEDLKLLIQEEISNLGIN